MYDVERPADEEISRLIDKYGNVPQRIVDWDQRDVDYRREMEDPPCFGEVILLIGEAEGRLAVVRARGSSPDAFDLPTGIIEEGERVDDVAIREALEETGRDVRVERLTGIYRVRVRWKAWNLERWFFAVRCLAVTDGGVPHDTEEVEEVKFVRLPEESPSSWSRSEWWGGAWRRQILEDGGMLS